MPHWLIHGAVIAGRVLAGCIGALAFYMAYFLFEDEQGLWQNKLDDLWISIYDRAKKTDTTATALFNTLAQIITSWCDRIFGVELLSFHMFVVSTTLSLCGAALALLLWTMFPPMEFLKWRLSVFSSLFIVLAAACYVSIKFARWWVDAIVFLACWVPSGIFFRNLVWEHDYADFSLYLGFFPIELASILLTLPPLLLFSTVADIISIATLRNILESMADTVYLRRVLRMCLSLFCVSVAIMPGPLVLLKIVHVSTDSDDLKAFTNIGSPSIIVLNATTAIYCIIPMLMLVGVIAHKLLWPLLSRALYPLCQYRIVSNRKALKGCGGLAFTFAFNLAPVGLKDLMNLLK